MNKSWEQIGNEIQATLRTMEKMNKDMNKAWITVENVTLRAKYKLRHKVFRFKNRINALRSTDTIFIKNTLRDPNDLTNLKIILIFED